MLNPRRAGVCHRLDQVKGQAVSLVTKMVAWHSCPNTRTLPSSRLTWDVQPISCLQGQPTCLMKGSSPQVKGVAQLQHRLYWLLLSAVESVVPGPQTPRSNPRTSPAMALATGACASTLQRAWPSRCFRGAPPHAGLLGPL